MTVRKSDPKFSSVELDKHTRLLFQKEVDKRLGWVRKSMKNSEKRLVSLGMEFDPKVVRTIGDFLNYENFELAKKRNTTGMKEENLDWRVFKRALSVHSIFNNTHSAVLGSNPKT